MALGRAFIHIAHRSEGQQPDFWAWANNNPIRETIVNRIVYIVGLIVVVLAVLAFFGFR